ncbi:MAG: phosphoglucosamine mutase, partial [Acidimicrobiales bacterium]
SDPALDPHGRRRPVAGAVGTVVDGAPLLQAYEEHLVGSLDGRDLAGLRVVLDCANGAAARIAPRVVAALGAEVDVIEAEPDGTNINAGCGALHPGSLGRAVLSAGADLGLAFDGDADRLVAVDHAGATVDGDHLLALFALDLRSRSLLGPDAVVVTVMSNLGFHQAMRAAGIDVVQTPVGDRHVLDAIEARGLSLGGEQSGHIIFRRLATTGDGLLTGLQLADLLRRSGRPLTELAAGAMTRLPQRLANLAVDRPSALEAAAEVWQEVAAVESELAGSGRVLLRASGTEPVVRVMVEAPTDELAGELVSRLSQAVERALGRGAEAAPEGAMGPGRSLLPAPALETGQAVAE